MAEELSEFKYLCLLTLNLTGKISTPGLLISELADYLVFSYLSCSRKGMPLLYIKTILLYWHQVFMKLAQSLNVLKVAL